MRTFDRKTVFEVGKSYTCWGGNGRVYKCLCVGKIMSFFSTIDNKNEVIIKNYYAHKYDEYVPKKEGELWVALTKTKSVMSRTRHENWKIGATPQHWSGPILAIKHVKWTEGDTK